LENLRRKEKTDGNWNLENSEGEKEWSQQKSREERKKRGFKKFQKPPCFGSREIAKHIYYRGRELRIGKIEERNEEKREKESWDLESLPRRREERERKPECKC